AGESAQVHGLPCRTGSKLAGHCHAGPVKRSKARFSTRQVAPRRQGFVATFCVVALLLLGSCNSGNGVVTVASTKANLRVVNLIPNANGPINVTLDGNPFAAGVAFESLQPYQQIDAVTQANPSSTLKASVTGSVSSLITSTFIPLSETN